MDSIKASGGQDNVYINWKGVNFYETGGTPGFQIIETVGSTML